MLAGAKTNWSQATRAAMVRFVVERCTREARKEYHFVAAGPKMTGRGQTRKAEEEREGEGGGGSYRRRSQTCVLCA